MTPRVLQSADVSVLPASENNPTDTFINNAFARYDVDDDTNYLREVFTSTPRKKRRPLFVAANEELLPFLDTVRRSSIIYMKEASFKGGTLARPVTRKWRDIEKALDDITSSLLSDDDPNEKDMVALYKALKIYRILKRYDQMMNILAQIIRMVRRKPEVAEPPDAFFFGSFFEEFPEETLKSRVLNTYYSVLYTSVFYMLLYLTRIHRAGK